MFEIIKKKCSKCGEERDYFCAKANKSQKVVCTICEPASFPASVETVYIAGYGTSSKKRIESIKSRTILPYAHPDSSGYYVGTRGKDGKVREKEPDIHK